MERLKCKVCNVVFNDSPDDLILCHHHEGPIHFGCCVDRCSHDHKPCEHSLGRYKRTKYGHAW